MTAKEVEGSMKGEEIWAQIDYFGEINNVTLASPLKLILINLHMFNLDSLLQKDVILTIFKILFFNL